MYHLDLESSFFLYTMTLSQWWLKQVFVGKKLTLCIYVQTEDEHNNYIIHIHVHVYCFVSEHFQQQHQGARSVSRSVRFHTLP